VKEVCAKDLVIKAGPIRSLPANMQAAVQDDAQDMVEQVIDEARSASQIRRTRGLPCWTLRAIMFSMSENVENLVLEYLRRLDNKVNALDKKVDVLSDDVREARSVLSGVVQILASQDAHMLRVEVRLGDIEKRLYLHDPAIPG